MEIFCQFSDEVYLSGKVAVVLLRGQNANEDIFSATVFAQVHGHINTDFRWMDSVKNLREIFLDAPTMTFDQVQHSLGDPLVPNNHGSVCIFATSRTALSPSFLFKRGILLEFEIPSDIIPSFKGLCASVNYYVTVSFRFATSTRVMHFPLTVSGAGPQTVKHQIRHSSMTSYSVSSLPLETYLSSSVIKNEIESHVFNHHLSNGNIYSVRDDDHVCNVLMSTNDVSPGENVHVSVDFRENEQPCIALKASVIQCEMRPNKSRIQDKVVSTVIKSTEDVEMLNIRLHIPLDCPCSFSCALFQVQYRLDLEFCLEQKSNGISGLFDKAFFFSVPITIKPPSNGIVGIANDSSVTSISSSTLALQHLAHKCIVSDIVNVPLHINFR